MKSFLTKIKIAYWVALFAAGCMPQMATAQTLHAFLVIQNDPTIGSPTDKTTVEAFLREVKVELGIEVNLKPYSNTEMTQSKFDSELAALNTGSNDVIWFFYSGHGSNNGDGWPKTNGAGLAESHVYQKLKTKSARLKITTYDCCNLGANTVAFHMPRTTLQNNAFQKLFLQSKGDVLMASCEAEGYSYGGISQGGIFTCSLLKSLKTQTTWKNVLTTTTSDTKSTAQGIRRTQVPIGNAENVQIIASTSPDNTSSDGVQNNPVFANFTKTFTTGMSLADFAVLVNKECRDNFKIPQPITVATLKRWNQNPAIPLIGNGKPYKININDFSTKAKTATSTTTTSKGVKASSVVKKVMSNQK